MNYRRKSPSPLVVALLAASAMGIPQAGIPGIGFGRGFSSTPKKEITPQDLERIQKAKDKQERKRLQREEQRNNQKKL